MAGMEIRWSINLKQEVPNFDQKQQVVYIIFPWRFSDQKQQET